MQKIFRVCMTAVAAIIVHSSLAAAQVVSERGANALDAISKKPLGHRQNTIYTRPARPWASAPPTIPHKDKAYTVTKDYNVCMSCHVRNYQRMGAPKPTVSHFIVRDGQVDHSKLDSRRYFCRQCHVPQAYVEPLIGNTFTSVAIAPPKGSKQEDLLALGEYIGGECTGCHQLDKTVGGVRFLGGWEADALVHVLKAYKSGAIQNEAMGAVAEQLSDEDMKAVATYFASITPGSRR